jgi:hypothetical protein
MFRSRRRRPPSVGSLLGESSFLSSDNRDRGRPPGPPSHTTGHTGPYPAVRRISEHLFPQEGWSPGHQRDHAAQSHDADGQCREKKSLNRSILGASRRSIKGGSGESVAALRATGRRGWRRLRGRMMNATAPAKSAKRATITTDSISVRIYGSAAAAAVISSVFAFRVERPSAATPTSRCCRTSSARSAGRSGACQRAISTAVTSKTVFLMLSSFTNVHPWAVVRKRPD